MNAAIWWAAGVGAYLVLSFVVAIAVGRRLRRNQPPAPGQRT